MTKIEERALEILARACGNEALKKNLDMDLFEDDVFDSLAFISFVNGVEDEMGIELQPSTIKRDSWRTPRSILGIVTTRQQ